MAFADTVKFTAGSSGTSDFSDGTAVTGFRSLSTGAVSGQTYSYRAFSADLSQWENGQGVYTSGSPGTLARTTQYETSTGSKVSFTAAPVVILTPLKIDLDADQARQNFLLNLANMSKALASSLRVLNTFADGYKATDGINSGSTSNVDTTHTSSGYVGPTGGTTTTLNSQSTSAATAGNTFVDRSAAVPNGTIITKIGVYATSAQSVTVKVVKQNSTTNFDIVVSQSFSHPGGGWADVTLSSPYTVPGTGTYNIAVYSNATTDITAAVARSIIAGDQAVQTGLAGWTAASNSVPPMRYVSSVNNMTLVTTSQTADATTSWGRVLMEIDPIDTITLNTDLTAEVTCNGGTNWASATLLSIGKGQAGRTVVEIADTFCGANTGTSFAARIKSLNNKSVNIYKMAVTVH